MLRSGFARALWQLVQESRAQACHAKILPITCPRWRRTSPTPRAGCSRCRSPRDAGALLQPRCLPRYAARPCGPPQTRYEVAKTLGALVESGQLRPDYRVAVLGAGREHERVAQPALRHAGQRHGLGAGTSDARLDLQYPADGPLDLDAGLLAQGGLLQLFRPQGRGRGALRLGRVRHADLVVGRVRPAAQARRLRPGRGAAALLRRLRRCAAEHAGRRLGAVGARRREHRPSTAASRAFSPIFPGPRCRPSGTSAPATCRSPPPPTS